MKNRTYGICTSGSTHSVSKLYQGIGLCLKTSLLLANITVLSLHHSSNAYREIRCKAEFILNLSTMG